MCAPARLQRPSKRFYSKGGKSARPAHCRASVRPVWALLLTGALGALTGLAGLVGAGTLLLAVQGLDDLANALKKFGSMQWDEIGRGLAAMGAANSIITAC